MTNQNITRDTLVDSWKTYAFRLLMTIPQDGIAELDGRERRTKRTGAWVLWALVGVLAIASITNLADRAYMHKAGFSANVVGAGLALLVPVAVHYAIKVGGWWKVVIWCAAILFASISGTIQYQIYAPDGLFIFDKDHLEALAFGAGVPLAECILAGIAAIVLMQEAQKDVERKAEAEAAAAAERKRAKLEADEADVKRIAEDERQARLAHELETQRKDDDARRENERISADAKADATRIRAQKNVQKSVQSTVQSGVQNTVSTPSKTQSEGEQKDMIASHLVDNGWTGASALARAVNLSRSTVYNRLSELKQDGRVSNQDGKWATIAPALPAEPAIHLNGADHERREKH